MAEPGTLYVWEVICFTTSGRLHLSSSTSAPSAGPGHLRTQVRHATHNQRSTSTDPNPGDTVKYDVYFGTSSPPPLEAEDLNWAVYDPFGIDPMELGTVYYWQIVTEDSQGLTTEGPIWHFTTQLGPNDPPGAPTIDGPISGDPGTAYDYKFNAVDPDGDNVKYHIDWGDGNTDETDLNPSGTDVTVPHTWTKSGKYVITAYAEDANGLTGPSSTFQVTMPRDKATNNVLLWRLLEQFPVLQKMFLYFIK